MARGQTFSSQGPQFLYLKLKDSEWCLVQGMSGYGDFRPLRIGGTDSIPWTELDASTSYLEGSG